MATWLTSHHASEVPLWYKQSEKQAQKGHRAGWWHKQASSISTPGPSLTFPLHHCFTPIGWFCSSLSLSLSDTHTQTHRPRTKKEESETRLIFLEILLDGGVIRPVQEMCEMITVDEDRLCPGPNIRLSLLFYWIPAFGFFFCLSCLKSQFLAGWIIHSATLLRWILRPKCAQDSKSNIM